MSTYWERKPEAVREAMARYRTTDKYKNTVRHNRYKRLYGITLEEYNLLLKTQNYVCKICHCPETVISSSRNAVKYLAVDHCHDTGKIRGLLCDRCNHLLGLAKDSPTLLSSAISYLKEQK